MIRSRKPTSSLKSLSITELQALLEKKVAQERKKLPALKKKRDKIAAQLDDIENEIAAIGGVKPKRGRPAKKRGRPPKKATAKKVAKKRGRAAKKGTSFQSKRAGKTTIPAAIHAVLEKAGKPMKGVDIRDAIIKQKLITGRKKSFPAQVNMALSKHKEFKRKGRGVYSL